MQNKKLQIMLEVAFCGALAIIFDYIILFRVPEGGSVSLAMLPIFLIAYRRGLKAGLMTGLILGILQIVTNLSFVHPIQVLLDYLVACVAVGLAGVFSGTVKNALREGKKISGIIYIVLGAFIGSGMRFLAHFIAGVIFYASYAPEGTPVAIYSLVYNASYMVPSFILCATVLSILATTAPTLINVKK